MLEALAQNTSVMVIVSVGFIILTQPQVFSSPHLSPDEKNSPRNRSHPAPFDSRHCSLGRCLGRKLGPTFPSLHALGGKSLVRIIPYLVLIYTKSFKNILLAVVFANGRVGASRIQQGRFIITSATTGRLLSSSTWEEAVKAGMHLHQAIVIDEKPNLAKTCPYPSCGGILDLNPQPDERTWCVNA
jgi:hypothetical protein